MARSMLSLGMLLAFASATAARRRGLPLMSPPPMRAATVISLRMRVKIFPRLASAAPFLCLMVLHLLWPDIEECSLRLGRGLYSGCGDRLQPVPVSGYLLAAVIPGCANLGVMPI